MKSYGGDASSLFFRVENTRWQALTASVTKFFRLLECDPHPPRLNMKNQSYCRPIHKIDTNQRTSMRIPKPHRGIVNHVGANRFPVSLLVRCNDTDSNILCDSSVFHAFFFFFFAYIPFSREAEKRNIYSVEWKTFMRFTDRVDRRIKDGDYI